MTDIPETTKMPRRPVYERMLRRKHHLPLDPPTDEEKSDAIRVLRDSWDDDLNVEALRIMGESDALHR